MGELTVLWEESIEARGRIKENPKYETTCPGVLGKRVDNMAGYSGSRVPRISCQISVEPNDKSWHERPQEENSSLKAGRSGRKSLLLALA